MPRITPEQIARLRQLRAQTAPAWCVAGLAHGPALTANGFTVACFLGSNSHGERQQPSAEARAGADFCALAHTCLPGLLEELEEVQEEEERSLQLLERQRQIIAGLRSELESTNGASDRGYELAAHWHNEAEKARNAEAAANASAARFRRLNESLAEHVAGQSELLARRGEVPVQPEMQYQPQAKDKLTDWFGVGDPAGSQEEAEAIILAEKEYDRDRHDRRWKYRILEIPALPKLWQALATEIVRPRLVIYITALGASIWAATNSNASFWKPMANS